MKKDTEKLYSVIQSQKEIIGRYDSKASSYITIIANTFIIALFTLCIFTAVHDGSLQLQDNMFLTLLIVMIIYTLSFIACIILALLILWPRNKSKKINNKANTHLNESITFASLNHTFESIKYFINNEDELLKTHIMLNNAIICKKNLYSKIILLPMIMLFLCLLIVLICLFFI